MTYQIQIPDQIDLTLNRILKVLKLLDNPHLKIPPVIHVAGTNGKGSTIAFLNEILKGEGKSVHVYTSPHLIRVNERIVVAEHPISDEELSHFQSKIQGLGLSYFEELTCIAFLAFTASPADYVLLEVGLGGRLDATNVVDPVVSVITSISLDHQDHLGNTIDQIAQEKAGIIKPGKPVVLAHQNDKSVEAIMANISDTLGSLVVRSEVISDVDLGLAGDHQYENAATALTVAKLVLGDGDYSHHLKNAKWPGRLQQLCASPDIWVDGAHNRDGVHKLAQEIKRWRMCGKKIILAYSQLSNRDPELLMPALDLADDVVHIEMEQRDRFHPKQSATKKSFTPEQALLHFHEQAYNNTRILFMGSLYMVGTILEVWERKYDCNK